MNSDLVRAIDDLEIRRILARYCRGLDRMDVKLVESVFLPPEPGRPQVSCDGVFEGTAEDWLKSAFERGRSDLITAHSLQQSLIEVDGDTAEVETYFTIRYAYNEEDGGRTIMVVFGRYADIFAKRGGAWGIAHRAIILDARHYDRQGVPAPGAAPVGRRSDDPSFRLRQLAGDAVPV